MTGAVGWITRRHVRRRWPALVPVALIVAAGTTGALVTAEAAHRTAGAYDRYLDHADVSDVQVNPSLRTKPIDRAVRALPGVRSVTTNVVFFAGIDRSGGRPRTVYELNHEPGVALVLGSADGHFLVSDRPAVHAGRLPTGRGEALVDVELAEAEDVDLGDTLPLSFWGRMPGTDLHPDFVEPDQVDTLLFSPVGVEDVTVVGIGTLSDEVLADELYPRQRIVVSPDVAARYDCSPDAPPPDATFEQALDTLIVEGCAVSYRYYSLTVDGGAQGVASTMDAFLDRAATLNDQLPESVRIDGAGYYLIPTTTAQERERVERSTQPTVAALWVLACVAAAVTLAVAGLAIARELRRSEDDQAQWRHLGLTTPERMQVVALPLVAAVGVGLVVAVAAAWLLSPLGPVGSVRSIDPSPARALSGGVGLGLAAVALLAGLGTVVLAHRSARRAGRTSDTNGPGGGRAPSALQRFLRRGNRPEVAEGVRAAQTGYRGAGLVMASGGVAAGVFLAAVVFGTSLAAVVSTPVDYGWPWDVATMSSYGYGPVDVEKVAADLAERSDVASWTAFGFTSDVAVDGEPVLSVVGLDRTSTVDLQLVDGRLPRNADEVALGSRTAADQGVGVGDRVEIAGGGFGPTSATVSGLVVLPPLGPFVSDRASPGTGMLLPEAMAPTRFLAESVAFVGIDLVDGADPHQVATALHDTFASWDENGWVVVDYDHPVRPAEIVDARRMRSVPLLAGGLLVVAAVVGLALAVVLSVRSRRRELAILRALGFTGRQLRDSVRVQALVTMGVALVVGVPVGVAAGRLAWNAFAEQLGVAAGPVVPAGWIAVTVVGGLALAVLAAALPARTAARVDPADVLRSE